MRNSSFWEIFSFYSAKLAFGVFAMIIEFSVKNFRSFRGLTTLSLEAEALKTAKEGLISTGSKFKLLPVVGIFGHNASGKSNLIKALAYMQWAMLNSDYLNQPTTKSPLLQPFLLNEESSKEPSFFQIILWDPENEVNGSKQPQK